MSQKIAIVESKPSNNNYSQLFEGSFAFDLYHLVDDPNTKKVLKRDCTIDIKVDDYDFIILVGSEPLRFFTKETKITTYSGKLLDGKFLPTINPAMLHFKPEAKTLWVKSRDNILDYISGKTEETQITDEIVELITDSNRLKKYLLEALAYCKPYFACDTETTALYPRDGYVQGVCLSYDGEKGVYALSECFNEENTALLQKLFDKKTSIFHHAKFDISMIEFHFGNKIAKFDDTMLLHYLIDENPGNHGLKHLALHFTKYGAYDNYLKEWIDNYRKEHGILKGDFNWGDIPPEVMYPYACLDAICTFVLFERFRKILENPELASVYNKILIPGTRFLVKVENNGVPFDIDRLYAAQTLIQTRIDDAIKRLRDNKDIAAFEKAQGAELNVNSVVQLRRLFFDFMGLKPTSIKTEKGENSTSKEALQKLSSQSDIPALILEVRQWVKIKNTYIDKIIPQLNKDGRLRTNFNMHTTTSGRLSSSGKFNMQQIPRDNPIVKGCIRAKPGSKIVSLDLSTAEMYVASILSGDKNLQNVFKLGQDFHSTIAKQVFGLPCEIEDVKSQYPEQRQAAKAVSFGILYGAGPWKISEQITKDSGKPFSKAQAEEVISKYFRQFPDLAKWIKRNQELVEAKGFIYSYFGRKRRVPNVRSSDRGIKGHAIRSALNFLVQSVASDINLLGAIEMQDFIEAHGMKAKIFALVHDSILAEVPEEELDLYCETLTSCVQRDRGLTIPGHPIGVDIEIGQDYSFGKFEEEYSGL